MSARREEAATPHLDRHALAGQSPDYRLLFDRSPQPMWVSDRRTSVFLAVNDAAIAHYGYSREQFLGMTALDIRPLEDVPRFLTTSSGARTGIAPGGVWRHRKRDGTIITVEVTVSDIVFGGMVARLTVINDITERERTARQLAEAQALTHVGSWDWDLITDRLTWSDEHYRIFGLDPKGPIAYRGAIECLHPADRPMLERLVAQSLKDGRPYTCEFRVLHADGTERVVEAHAKMELDGIGRPIRTYGTAQDVTERRRAAEALARSRAQLRDFAGQLRSARERERAHIAREIHDELGQALTGLKMSLFRLHRGVPADQRPGVEEETLGMAALIDAMIDKVRTLATELRPAILDSMGLSAAVEWAVRQFSERTAIACALDLPPEPIAVDPERSTDVFRILQEALTNVARHAGATAVGVHVRVNPGELVLEVRDNGRGITSGEAADPRAFGLLGMRERALAWGGEVGVAAAPLGGTAVTVCIPVAPSNPEVAG